MDRSAEACRCYDYIEVGGGPSTVKAAAKRRLTDSVKTALNLADGIVVPESSIMNWVHRIASSGLREAGLPPTYVLAVDDLSRGRSVQLRPTAPVP